MNWFYIVYVYLTCVSLPADVLWGSVTHSFLPRYLFQAHLRGGGGGGETYLRDGAYLRWLDWIFLG